MTELFEVISREEYESSTAPSVEVRGEGQAARISDLPDLPLEWCEFCKGYYILEFHHGDRSEDEPSR